MRFLILGLLFTLFLSCGEDIGKEVASNDERKTSVGKKFDFNNTTILLDFSNRLLEKNQKEKDLKAIKFILSEFEKNQKKYAFQISKDKLRVTLAYQKNSIADVFSFGESLTIDMEEDNMNRPKFVAKKKVFLESLEKLYDNGLKSPMTGADIWTFFRDSSPTFISHSDEEKYNIKNKVIILSDGYLQFDQAISRNRPKGTYMRGKDLKILRQRSEWKEKFDRSNFGLTPHDNSTYENLSVLMLEIDPRNPAQSTNEFQIVKHYWEDWFTKMGIPCTVLKMVENLSNIESEINRFLEE